MHKMLQEGLRAFISTILWPVAPSDTTHVFPCFTVFLDNSWSEPVS